MASIPNVNKQQQPTSYTEQQAKQTEKTLYDLRVEHEEAIKNLRARYVKAWSDDQMNRLKKYGDLSKDQVGEIMSFEKKIRDKYAAMYRKELEDNKNFEKELEKRIAQQTYNEARKHQKQEAADKYKLRKEDIKLEKEDLKRKKKNNEITKEEYKKQRKEQQKDLKQDRKQTVKAMKELGASTQEILSATIGEQMTNNLKASLTNVASSFINGWKQKLSGTIETYGKYQQRINTRIQGSGTSWKDISRNIEGSLGPTPWLKTQQVMDNVVKATEQGIAFNIEQRAFLETIKESIANTFDAFDSNLSRIIRIQQADSTAARLGLEATLTQFFNANFSDTSYLSSTFDTVSQNLLEATSMMDAASSVGFEYQVQKWLGSLVSVGFSESAAGQIASALGMLGSGNVSGLANSGALQNLLVMSASRAGLNYSDLLVQGLDESNTNKLLQSMVTYLQEIADSDNKVVKSQYAQIFGMNVSDLSAVKNLIGQVNDIAKSTLSYGQAVNELYDQMTWANLTERIGTAGMLQNLMENSNYRLGQGIASNPVTYALWQITDMIEDVTGGIALPTISMMGNMVDLNTTVTNLMRAGIVGVSSLSTIGSIISGIGNTVNPSNMLASLGINKTAAKQLNRGSGLNRRLRSSGVSSSTLVGNTAADDYYAASTTAAEDTKTSMIEANKESNTDITLNDMHQYLLQVFDPKITEIERLVALLAGYNVGNVQANTNFGTYSTGSGGQVYGATSVKIEDDMNKNTSQLATINQNVASILNILQTGVISVQPVSTIGAGLAEMLP